MAEPFIAEIRMCGYNFAPRNYAFCNGQIQGIAQNTALFSLLGTTYGGNGTTTFGLPNLQGRSPLHPGQGPGLSLRDLGEFGGSETVTLITAELPAHSHAALGDATAGGDPSPTNHTWGRKAARTPKALYAAGPPTTSMSGSSLGTAGGSQPHNNLAPFMAISFIIAIFGAYPSRN